ncbi:MAG: D-2-hydroxyacid dehydrogenase [Provencibacterium sp.]|nr:D-2-hydroxyacid dehydrogenase [Provencibacterium sp.]
MNQLQSVLITLPMPEPYLSTLLQTLHPATVHLCQNNDAEGIKKALETADAAILNGDITDLIMTGEKLRWIHCDHSGLTRSARPDVFRRGIAVTGSAGRSAPTLAEHAILFMLALTYDLHGLHELQKKHQWGGLPGYNDRRGLIGKTVGIIGLGHTGKALAVRCKAFGMQVLGYRRRAEPVECVDRLYARNQGDGFEPLLQESDYLVLTTQLSDETYHMIDAGALRKMKPTAYLINMCRGSVVDEPALIEALNGGVIAGAGVDTTEVEPLPADSPLWDAKNLMLTPHNTPTVPNRWERSCSIICENAARFREGRALLNQITPQDVYTKG